MRKSIQLAIRFFVTPKDWRLTFITLDVKRAKERGILGDRTPETKFWAAQFFCVSFELQIMNIE